MTYKLIFINQRPLIESVLDRCVRVPGQAPKGVSRRIQLGAFLI